MPVDSDDGVMPLHTASSKPTSVHADALVIQSPVRNGSSSVAASEDVDMTPNAGANPLEVTPADDVRNPENPVTNGITNAPIPPTTTINSEPTTLGISGVAEPLPSPKADSPLNVGSVPDEPTAAQEESTAPSDEPTITTPLPTMPANAADEPNSSDMGSIAEVDVAPTKIAHERDEDVDTEEPAAKRVKTDEGTQEEHGPAAIITQTMESAPEPEPTSAIMATPVEPQVPQTLPSSTKTRQEWGDMTEVQHKRLLEGMRNLKKGKHASLFSKPVDPVQMKLPTYFDVIKEPMDLSSMESKLKNREYPSVADYVGDFDRMVNNAIRFNGQQHPVAQSGMMIRSQFEAQLRKLPKPGEPVPEPPSKPKRASFPGPTREHERRQSRQSLGNTAASPNTSFAPDANGVPLARRDSMADRPKRKIQRPAPREIQYPKAQKKKYKAELQFANEVLTELERGRYHAFAAPFANPVDPVALGIPNYHQIIKKPMDVSTIRQKLNEQQYENLKEFEVDFRLMFKNCYKFNPDGHPVNNLGKQYEQLFDEQMAKKNERVKALAPPSERESPEEEDEDEEDEESEEEDDAQAEQQKQLAQLNAQLKALTDQAAKLMAQKAPKVAKGPKDKKGKGSKLDSTKKKKLSGVGAAPVLKKEKSKPKTKAKVKPLTQKDKEEIAARIFELPTDEISAIADKIKKAMRARGDPVPDDSEMEFNIDDIPDEILHDILKRLRSLDGRRTAAKDADDDFDNKADTGGTYAPKSKRNRPMSRTDTANQMAALQQQIDSFNGGNAGSPPAKMESSDDDESGSESEEE